MRKQAALNLAYTLLAYVLFSSCSSTNYLTLSVVEPSAVYVPQNLKRAGILNQTLQTQGNKKLDDLDKILSVEGKNLDKDGAYASALGLVTELRKNERFTEVKLIESAVQSPGMGVMPAPIPWATVNKICQENRIDVLFVLSLYDTDTRVSYAATPVEMGSVAGVKIPGIEHQATLNTKIKTGWRVYDPVNKNICDEYMTNEHVTLTGRGVNPIVAAQAIAGLKEAILQTSSQMGQDYSYRILPYSIRVSRDYYVRGTDNFKIAKRRAQTGNWDGAGELWHKEVTNPKSKIAGRATYNMAIINEINGNLDAAIDWASKSYSDHGNKLALSYLNILKNRKAKNEQLRRETEEPAM